MALSCRAGGGGSQLSGHHQVPGGAGELRRAQAATACGDYNRIPLPDIVKGPSSSCPDVCSCETAGIFLHSWSLKSLDRAGVRRGEARPAPPRLLGLPCQAQLLLQRGTMCSRSSSLRAPARQSCGGVQPLPLKPSCLLAPAPLERCWAVADCGWENKNSAVSVAAWLQRKLPVAG